MYEEYKAPELKSIHKFMFLISEFHVETGRRGFIYDDLRRWYYKTGKHVIYGDWHRVERWVRRLAEFGILLRWNKDKMRRMIFVIRKNDSLLFKKYYFLYKEYINEFSTRPKYKIYFELNGIIVKLARNKNALEKYLNYRSILKV